MERGYRFFNFLNRYPLRFRYPMAFTSIISDLYSIVIRSFRCFFSQTFIFFTFYPYSSVPLPLILSRHISCESLPCTGNRIVWSSLLRLSCLMYYQTLINFRRTQPLSSWNSIGILISESLLFCIFLLASLYKTASDLSRLFVVSRH